ncbi:MAG: N-acetyltransferase family protein [Negativicutes bacterium]|nr:N-acetyltransferase family protein [Negativicutes bacterium]
MKIKIREMSPEDKVPIIDIFNYYVEYSFAAYPENKADYNLYNFFLKSSDGYPTVVAQDEDGELLGFGMLRAYDMMSVFKKTAEISYFIKPGYTGRGIGKIMLAKLLDDAKRVGITCILANISSFNSGSIRFHQQNGFIECGRFNNIGRKNGKDFGVVWMQKQIL